MLGLICQREHDFKNDRLDGNEIPGTFRLEQSSHWGGIRGGREYYILFVYRHSVPCNPCGDAGPLAATLYPQNRAPQTPDLSTREPVARNREPSYRPPDPARAGCTDQSLKRVTSR